MHWGSRGGTVALIGASILAMTGGIAAAEVPGDRLQESVDGWASDIGAPGMTAHIVDADGVVAQASSGVDGNSAPIDAETPFVWGSVSKQFAAATVLGLEERGVVDGDESVVDVVPQATGMLPDPAVTVDDLVHHTSGLPHDITVTDDWTRRTSASEAVASMSPPQGMNGRGTFRYSSLNYLLLQAVVEQATGGSYADALREQVLVPSGAAAITDPDEFVRTVPPGHVPFFGSARSVDVGVDAAGLGYGYLAGSIDDLGRYASWRLGQLQDVSVVDTGQGAEYGGGLFRESIAGQQVWWHSGAVPGYYTYVALVPGANVAMVLATNRYGEMEADRIAAVGRNLTTSILDGSASDLPGSSTPVVLGVLFGVITALAGFGMGMVLRFARGRQATRSLGGTVARIVGAVVVGGVVALGAYLGVPSLVGASMSTMWLWAPDVTIAFWLFLGTTVLVTAVVVTVETLGCRRLRR